MRSGLIYIGDKAYQRTTVLLELEVLELLQKQAKSEYLTLSEQLNKQLLVMLRSEKNGV